MEEAWDRSKGLLHYGACITLTLSEGSYIVSSGFIDDSLRLHAFSIASNTDFISAVFRVLPSVSYVVQGEVLNSVKKTNQGVRGEMRERILALDDNLEDELRTNIQNYAKLKGEPVKFGTVVQFEHISSHKYITISGRENAERERDSLRISLQNFSEEHSLFKLEPIYQYQREGDGNIRYGEKVHLTVMVLELGKYVYLHCSPQNPEKAALIRKGFRASRVKRLSKLEAASDDLEINGSLESPSDWQVMPFMPYIKENSDLVCVGDHIWLTQSEAETCLTATLGSDGNAEVSFTKNLYDSNGMWKIEAETYKIGGFIELGVGFRLRHICTGWYLAGSQGDKQKTKKNRITSLIVNSLKLKRNTARLTLVRHSEESTLWRFKPINSRKKTKCLQRDEYFKMEHMASKSFVHNSEKNDEVYPALSGNELESSIFKISRSDQAIIWETLFLIHSLPILRHFPSFMKKQKAESASSELISQNREFKRYLSLLRKCMENLMLFCCNKLQSMMSLTHKYGQVESSRQNILREQHFLNALGDILQCAFTGPFELKRISRFLLEKASERSSDKHKPVHNQRVYSTLLSIDYAPGQQFQRLKQDFEKSQAKDLADIVELTYELISLMCTDNRDNKKVAFRLFPVMQQHAPFLRNATLCMQTIVQNNEELLILLHKSEGLDLASMEILRFSSERRPQLLRFLRVICTHNGQGISVNQEKVHEQLFNNPDTYSKTIITTMTQEDRKRLFVFFKAAEGPGEKSIPLDSCFVDGQVTGYEKELAYFKEMLELFAAMCCSRNYVCTETIRNWFPITAVQENMWNANISLSLRAVFCKLMLTIYIDAYPRERLKKPEMCRIFQQQDEFTSRRREIDQRHGLTTETTAEIRKIASSFSTAIRKAGAARGSLGGSIGAIVTSAIPEAKPLAEDELVFNSDNSIMLELKEAILGYFNEMGEAPEFTEFSYNLVKMAYQMALFGLFSIEYTDFSTRKIILSPKHKSYLRSNMDFARLLRALQRILTKSSVDALSLRTYSSRHLSGLQSKAKRSAFTYKSLMAQVMKDPYSLADPIVRAAVNLKNYVESVLQKPGKEEEEGSYELEMKIEVCKVLDYAVDCRLDYLMSNVVEWFVQNQNEEVTKKTFKALFPPILPIKYAEGTDVEHQKHQIKKMLMLNSGEKSAFRKMLILEVPDLDELLDAKGRIVADLVRVFIQSKQYQLQTLIITLLIRLYSQRRELLARLSELHVVTQEDDIEIFKSTKQNIIIFKQFSEQSEIWLKFWRQTDSFIRQREEEKLHKVMAILEYLDTMLTPEDEGMKRRMRDRQDMLYFLDVHQLLISLIRDGMHSLAEVVDLAVAKDVVPAKEQIVALFTLCHTVLRKMVERNARNQGSMHEYLHIFTSHLSIEVGQIPLICAIYHNNRELCMNVKLETLQQFIKLIIQHGRQPRFLHLFQHVQVAKGQPLPDNQRTVLSLFLSSEETRKYLLYLGNEAEHEFSFVPAQPHDQALSPYEDQPFLYHAKLFEVLMLCGYGTQRVYLNEAKCQKAIPLNTVFDLLERAEDETMADYQSWQTLLIPLLDFFFNIYLETEKLNEELAGNVKFLRYVQLQEERLYSFSTLPSHYTAYFSIFIKVISHYAQNYLRVTSETMAAEQTDYVALRNFAVAFSRNLRKFHGWVVAKEVRTAAKDVLKFFNLSGDLESLLRVNVEDLPADQAVTTDIDEFYSPNKIKWEAFRGNLLSNNKAKKQCKKETEALIKALINCKKLDETLHFSHLLNALIDYLRGSATQHAPTSTVLKLIKMLSYLIKSDKEHLKERQEELNSYGATRVILGLLSEKELDQRVYKALIKLSVDYLNEGNEAVQNEFHMYFVNTPSSKNFIERLHGVLAHHSELLASDSIQYDWTDLNGIDHLCASLRLLQLFCENHNSNLQNYLRQQTNSRTSIDLVTATVKLLAALMKRMLFRTFLVMSQCFDTLTEAIQGPCVANQNAIIDGPFLEIATSLMSYDESAPTPLKYLSLMTEGNAFPDPESEKKYLTGWMIAHLKYKCLITVHSLMEGRTDSSIITRIIRAINLEILKENLVGIYVGYEREFSSATADLSLFGRAEKSRKYDFTRSDNEQDLHPRKYEVVLENGFFIYHLMRKFQDTDDPENKQLINEELPKLSTHNLQNDMMAFRVIGDLSKLGVGIVKKSVQSISQVSKKLIHSEKSASRIELSESEKKEKLSKAYRLLQENTGSIEIIFNNSISRVYFPLPPYAHCLTADIIEDFHSKVDRSSDKNKLQCLVNKAPEVIEVMKHEYRLQRIINASWIVGMIARNVTLWKDLSFWLTLLLNFLILASFSTYSTERTQEYSLFYYESRRSGPGLSFHETQEMFISLGVAQIVITSVIVLFFLIKVGPLLLSRGWRKVTMPVPRPGCVRRMWLYGQKLYHAIALLLGEVDVLFYVLYLLFAVFGTFASPLFFAFHLLDILYRYPSLQNVIKSVTIPKKALLVTSLFSLILVYYFSIIAYAYFYDSFHAGDCDDLLTCTIITFDHSFKVNGGIGGALVDWPFGETELSRLLFDNLYNIIIIVIMINIFQGIIIDTFAVLREENTRNSLDRSTKCFICGLERDTVERATGRSFDYHTYFEHNEWKYVQFIGYLKDKEETELTGVESYVKEKLAKKEISWFPQLEGLSIKRDGESEEAAFFAESKEISDAVKEAAYQTQQLKKLLGLGGV